MRLKIQNASVEIKGKTILESINFEINDGEHIAVVGKNGAGKTTLLNAIIDNDMLSEGVDDTKFEIIKVGNIKIGYLQQIKINEDLTLIEELTNSFEEIKSIEKKLSFLEDNLNNEKNIETFTELMERYKLLGGYTYKKEIEVMIKNFGFTESDKNKKISFFSGGEKMRISFIKLLLSNPDLLILDEPTNHLDISTIEWLEDYLKNYKKAFIVVSHDRMFLDNIVNVVYDIEYGETIRYKANYSKFVQMKKAAYEKQLKDYEWQQAEIKRLTRIYEKFIYKPTKASMAQSKLKQIERMTLIDKPRKEDTRTFKTNTKDILKPGKIVLTAKDIDFGFDTTLGKIDFTLERGKKLGIIGKNGIGKSTLLKTLSSIIKPLNGKVEYGYNVKHAYFDQNLTFKTNGTIYEEFRFVHDHLNNEEVRKALGSFLFTGEDVDKKLSVLSGGEKVRLLLCEIFFSKANLMFLDEPTNHLDIIGKEKLEKTLKEYPETIVFVSHDRYFVKELADELIVFDDDKIKYYKYGYEEYIEDKNKSKAKEEVKIEKKEPIKKNNSYNEKNIIKRIEKELNALYKKEQNLKNETFKEEVYSDYQKLNEINKQLEVLMTEIKEKENEWESYM